MCAKKELDSSHVICLEPVTVLLAPLAIARSGQPGPERPPLTSRLHSGRYPIDFTPPPPPIPSHRLCSAPRERALPSSHTSPEKCPRHCTHNERHSAYVERISIDSTNTQATTSSVWRLTEHASQEHKRNWRKFIRAKCGTTGS